MKEDTSHGATSILHSILHNHYIHITLLALLFLDALICLTCGVLEVFYLDGKAEDCEAFVSKCVTSHRRLSNYSGTPSWLLNADRVYEDLSVDEHAESLRQLSSVNDTGCIEHPHFGDHSLHDAEKVLAYVSIGILAVFLIEQFLLMCDLGKDYLQPVFILDFFVVVVSLVLEVILTKLSFMGLLVVARIWRFARVGHGSTTGHLKVQDLVENDEVFDSLVHAWESIPRERWHELRGSKEHHISHKDFEESLSEEELEFAKSLGRSNPALILRALALAHVHRTPLAQPTITEAWTLSGMT